jgi:hypothetical protein
MTESSSSELALREELSKAHDEARQAKANLEQSAKRVSALESECAKRDPTTDKVRGCNCTVIDVIDHRSRVVEFRDLIYYSPWFCCSKSAHWRNKLMS